MPDAQLNGHRMHYEVHGAGDPLLLTGGWGTFCHGRHVHLPEGLTDRYSVIVFDHRGIGDSDDAGAPVPSTRLYAADALALLDHLGVGRAHLVGLIGMGACITQEMALARPGIARSLVNTGAWVAADRFLSDQLGLLLDIHRAMGWAAFQRAVMQISFEPQYYARNIDRLAGPQGPWGELRDRVDAHARFVQACVTHDVRDRIGSIAAPTLVVHAALDQVTGPRLTRAIEEGIPGAVGHTLAAAHVIAGRPLKTEFNARLLDFLQRH